MDSNSFAIPPGTCGVGNCTLLEEDFIYTSAPPLSEAFGYAKIHNIDFCSEDSTMRDDLADKLILQQIWVEKVNEWQSMAAGLELAKEDAAQLFIKVLWKRYCEDDKGALSLLQAAQRLFFSAPWPKTNLFIQNVDSDAEENGDLIPSDEFVVPFHAKSHKEWCGSFQNDSIKQLDLCNKWARDLIAFFNLDDSITPTKSSKNSIMVLRQMRAINSDIYSQQSWIHAVKSSHLANILKIICHPSTKLELSAPHVSASFHEYSWKESFGEVLDRWTNNEDCEMPMVMAEQIISKDSLELNELNIVRALSYSNCIIPTPSNPSSAFFLMSLKNFKSAWDRWLLPTLQDSEFQILAWNPVLVHRTLRSMDIPTFEKTYPEIMHPRLRKILVLTADLVKELLKTKEFSHRPRSGQHKYMGTYNVNHKFSSNPNLKKKKSHHNIKETLLAPGSSKGLSISPRSTLISSCASSPVSFQNNQDMTNTLESGAESHPCKLCIDQDPKDQCVWYHDLEDNGLDLEGAIITCAEPDDRLLPKEIKTKNKKIYSPKFFTPEELHLEPIVHRPDVHQRCGKDVHILQEKGNKNLIGAVQFKGFSHHVLSKMKDHHTQISKFKPLKRGSSFQHWDYGTMRPFGYRMPQGGKPGDTYAPYPGIDGSTDKELEALFGHAYSAQNLRIVCESMAPEVKKAIQETDKLTSDLNSLGTDGSNLYACTDYMSPQHHDSDTGISLTTQLFKRSKEDEWNFAYSQWGVYIQTEENTVWVFYASHTHGTIMPRHSSYKAALDAQRANPGGQVGSSIGNHTTRRKKDVAKARHHHTIRENYDRRSAIWDSN